MKGAMGDPAAVMHASMQDGLLDSPMSADALAAS